MAEYAVVLGVITLVIVGYVAPAVGRDQHCTEQGHHSTELGTKDRANRNTKRIGGDDDRDIRSHSEAESGQTMAEYALVVGVITFVIVATFALLSATIVAAYPRTFDILTSVV